MEKSRDELTTVMLMVGNVDYAGMMKEVYDLGSKECVLVGMGGSMHTELK